MSQGSIAAFWSGAGPPAAVRSAGASMSAIANAAPNGLLRFTDADLTTTAMRRQHLHCLPDSAIFPPLLGPDARNGCDAGPRG